MGHDFCAPGVDEGIFWNGVVAETMALRQIHRLVTSHDFDRTALNQVLERLLWIDRTHNLYSDLYAGETQERIELAKISTQRLREINERLYRPFRPDGTPVDLFGFEREQFFDEHEKAVPILIQVWTLQVRFIAIPPWQRDRAGFESKQEQLIERLAPSQRRSATVPFSGGSGFLEN